MGSRGHGEGCAKLWRTRSRDAESQTKESAGGGADRSIDRSTGWGLPRSCHLLSRRAPVAVGGARAVPSPGKPMPRPRPRLREGHAPSSPAGPSGARRERGESARWLGSCAPRPPRGPASRARSGLPSAPSRGALSPASLGKPEKGRTGGETPWPGPCPAPRAVASSGTGFPGRLGSPRSGWRTRWLGPGRARVAGGVTTDRVIWSPRQAEAQDEALEGGGPRVARLQLPAVCVDVPGGPAARPPPGNRARPAPTAAAHPGRAHRPPGPVPSSAAGRPGRGGASRTLSLGRASPGASPSGGLPASARARALRRAAVRAARARGARERAGPGLHVGRDGAVPLLRRRVRGGRAHLRPGPPAPAPAEARAPGAGARAPVLPPDGLRGRGLLPGRAEPLPHAATAVGAGVPVRVTATSRPAPCPCDGAPPALARTEFT